MNDGNKIRHYFAFKYFYYNILKRYKHSLKAKHQSHIIDKIQNHKIKIIDSTAISLCLSHEKVRGCPMHYITLNYVCNELKSIVKKAKKHPKKHFLTEMIPHNKQSAL